MCHEKLHGVRKIFYNSFSRTERKRKYVFRNKIHRQILYENIVYNLRVDVFYEKK